MAGTGESHEGAGFMLPPLPAEMPVDEARRWLLLEDYLGLRGRVIARVTSDDTNYVTADSYNRPIIWDEMEEDTTNLWDGGSKFIITKETAGDYLFTLDCFGSSGSTTTFSSLSIMVNGITGQVGRGPFGQTVTTWKNLKDGDEVQAMFDTYDTMSSVWTYPALGSNLRILRLI